MSDNLKLFLVTYHYPNQEHCPNTQRILAKDRDSLEKTINEMFDPTIETITDIQEL